MEFVHNADSFHTLVNAPAFAQDHLEDLHGSLLRLDLVKLNDNLATDDMEAYGYIPQFSGLQRFLVARHFAIRRIQHPGRGFSSQRFIKKQLHRRKTKKGRVLNQGERKNMDHIWCLLYSCVQGPSAVAAALLLALFCCFSNLLVAAVLCCMRLVVNSRITSGTIGQKNL